MECIGRRLYDDSYIAGACHDARRSISFVAKANWMEPGVSLGAFVAGPEEKPPWRRALCEKLTGSQLITKAHYRVHKSPPVVSVLK